MSFNNKFTVTEEFKNSNTYHHAINEFNAVYTDDTEDGMQVAILQCVMELLQTFSGQGHSGTSSAYVLNLFQKLADYEPLGPLTGADSEWTHLGYDSHMQYQNKRCAHVFKGEKGAYDSQYYIFVDPNGAGYTNSESRKYIEFPYVPTRVYVPRDEAGTPMWDKAEEK